MPGDSTGHLTDRAETEDGHAATSGNVCVLHGLPGRGEHIGQEQEAVVVWAIGDLDRSVVGVWYPEQFGLPTGHLTVELRVAEQCCPAPLIAYLGCLALRLQTLVAHETVAARDVEWHHDPVPDVQVRHAGTNCFHDAHRFMAEYVPGGHERCKHLVEMQVRTAQPAGGDPDDGIGRIDDHRVGDGVDLNISSSMPDSSAHLQLLATVGRQSAALECVVITQACSPRNAHLPELTLDRSEKSAGFVRLRRIGVIDERAGRLGVSGFRLTNRIIVVVVLEFRRVCCLRC